MWSSRRFFFIHPRELGSSVGTTFRNSVYPVSSMNIFSSRGISCRSSRRIAFATGKESPSYCFVRFDLFIYWWWWWWWWFFGVFPDFLLSFFIDTWASGFESYRMHTIAMFFRVKLLLRLNIAENTFVFSLSCCKGSGQFISFIQVRLIIFLFPRILFPIEPYDRVYLLLGCWGGGGKRWLTFIGRKL